MEQPRSKKKIIIIAAVILFLIIAVGTFLVLQMMQSKIDNNPTAETEDTSQVQPSDISAINQSIITPPLD